MVEVSSARVDPVQVRRFLEAVHGRGAGRGELVLYAQRGQGGRRTERRQAGVDLDPTEGLKVQEGSGAAEAFGLQELVDGGWDVYVTPCRFNPSRPPGTRKQADVVWTPGVWVDLDVKPTLERQGICTPEEMDRVVRALPEPTLLVDSGSGGRHAYWLLEEGSGDHRGVRRLGLRWLETVRRTAAEALGKPELELDRVCDLSRVMRLAGTWRQPGKTSRDGISEPRPVVILGEGRRWRWDELEALIPGEVTRDHERLGERSLVRPGKVDPLDPRLGQYAQGRLRGEAEQLAQTEAGAGRNSQLNRAAWLMGTLGAVGLLDRDGAWEVLREACRTCGLLEEDGEWQCDATFGSGWDAGLGEPHHLPDMSGLGEGSRVGDVWPSPQQPLEVARRLVRAWALRDDESWVRYWRGDWMRRVESGAWEEVEELAVEKAVYDTLGAVCYQTVQDGEPKLVDWNPNLTRVANVLKAMKTVCLLEGRAEPPSWLGPGHRNWRRAGGVLCCRNGIVDLVTRERREHDPRLFTLVSVPFDYDPGAWLPGRWLQFLGELWGDDAASVDCLQEIFGYVLSGRTDLQKIPLLVGPRRAGKGTIARVLTGLVGEGNVVGVSLQSLRNNFGLQPLLDKPLAIISDARIGGETDQLVERLLSISGEDTVTVDRKYKDTWTGQLPTRFLVISNELPRLRDASGAIASRFITLTLHRSWYGEENPQLQGELLLELPGILNWALEGLDRLTSRGRFTEGPHAAEAREAMETAGSPLLAFLRECCEEGVGLECSKDEFYSAWSSWAILRDIRTGGANVLARDLYAVAPNIRTFRPRTEDGRVQMLRGVRLKSGIDYSL